MGSSEKEVFLPESKRIEEKLFYYDKPTGNKVFRASTKDTRLGWKRVKRRGTAGCVSLTLWGLSHSSGVYAAPEWSPLRTRHFTAVGDSSRSVFM
jgi:hypothetical protein